MANMLWNAENDRKLLVNIMGQCSGTLDYTALAQIMTTPEHVCNEKSIRNRITRLKKEVSANESATEGGDGSAKSNSAKPTPTGQKRKAAKEKTDAPAKKRGKKKKDEDDETPVKVEKKGSETPVDDYDGEEDENRYAAY